MFNIKKSSKLSCGVPILDPHFDPERHVNAPNGFQNGEVQKQCLPQTTSEVSISDSTNKAKQHSLC